MLKQPSNDAVWVIKWIATIFVMVAITVRSAGYSPFFHMIDLVCTIVGTACWLFVSIAWKDRALIIMNVSIMFIMISGVLRITILS